ncbi:HAMP domain-containing histidine kinase [Reichenbachiella agarivorans]|uniref:histidine kinase n=1 Tax=Reichenbachiella agarivorans TaxID=2979464 RepID=A0ABY6CTT4_9BACT|nr:HAMP domain-containing sensor histidine kinase [Reichenbachiella agarivorans]UXP32873.1 HAMP domain-containing histidine kinase [Reichenbachiella agarivorans]
MAAFSGLILAGLFTYSQKDEAQIAADITKSVQKALVEINQGVSLIEQGKTSELSGDLDYILYNVRGDVLYWTDNSYIPPFEYFPFRTSEYIIANEQGEFLYQKKRITLEDQEVYVVVMISIRRKFNQSSTYLEDVYNRDIISHNVKITDESNSIPIKYLDEELFSIECSGNTYYNTQVNTIITGLLFVLFLGILISGFQFSYWINVKLGFLYGFFGLGVFLLVIRAVMTITVLPSSFVKLSIFEQSTFTYNWFYDTLGDSLINFTIVALLLVYAILYGRKFRLSLSKRLNVALGTVLLFFSYGALFAILNSISLLLGNSQISLDIAETMNFTLERFTAYLLIGVLSVIFFSVHYLAYHSLSSLKSSIQSMKRTHVICGLLSFVFLAWNTNFFLAFGLNVVYILGLYVFDMPQSLKALKFESINYLLFTVVIISIGGAFEIYKSYERNDLYRMQKFATYLQVDRDVEGEYLLSNILSQIKQDLVVNSKMLNPQSQLKSIERKIQRTYLNTYFSDYEINIHLFDKNGIGMSKKYRGMSINRVKKRYSAQEFQTSYENVFYDREMDINKRKRYICFTEVERYGDVNGYVEIELQLKKFSSRRVLPQLLLDRSIKSTTSYDYAMITNGEFIYVSGNYSYEADFDMEWLKRESLYNRGLDRHGYRHFAALVGDQVTVVSAPLYNTRDIVSNFSFLFIFLLMLTSIIGGARYLISDRRTSLNFSTKILIFTGGSFVIPLLLVAAAILSSTDNSYRKEIDKTNLRSTLLLAENLNDNFIEYETEVSSKEEFENSVAELATNASMDINVYDTKGKLMASSTPEIFESGIISEYLNPQAFEVLANQKKDQVAMDERIGSFLYKTIYVGINSPDDGSVLGYLAAPYFGSKSHLERQQLIVFTNIIIIFTFVFMVSIGIAYYVISRLTKPIMIIADRLHDTGFVQANQPIEWESDDEIGTLVHEYNNMLSKLEATKEELARNEKEAAWREMAKQVAHEIKNPLTPMKLTIQHLQRIMSKEGKDKKSLDILLSQIDTLDEIVTSFSHFAKMPTPLKEPFDIGYVLEKSIELHVDKRIELKIDDGDHTVLGDQKLFGRIFNNLILNAFQAMKNKENPWLQVRLKSKDDKILISFMDYGDGIPEDIRDKIFVPNFSTKDTGSGIGLAVAKRGIEHAGGSIWFNSEEGVGATFFIQMDNFNPKSVQ